MVMSETEKANIRRPFGVHTRNRAAPLLDGLYYKHNHTPKKQVVISAKQIKVVKIAMRQLGWTEEEYQLVLENVGVPIGTGGRRSCKRMTQRQFEDYVRHATDCGFDPTCGALPPTDRPSRAQMFRLHQLQQEVIGLKLGRRVGSNASS